MLTPFTGVWADRLDRRKTIITTQSLMMVQAFVLAILTITNIITIWEILLLSVVLGAIGAFDVPSRQAFVVEMVEDKKDLGNAIALNSSMVNAARMIGPALAGKLLELFGEGPCFLVNAISYIAVISALLAMTPTPAVPKPARKHAGREFSEGLTYAWRFLPIRMVLMLLALISLLGTSIMALAPIFARDILHGNARTLGYLMAFSGVGSLFGAAYLACRRNIVGLAEVLATAAAILGMGLIGFALSRTLWISLITMLFNGFGLMVLIAASNTMLQTIVDDDKRGRVMALWAMSFVGIASFGSLLAGTMAHWLGAPHTVLLGGAAVTCGAVLFASKLPTLRREIQPVLERLNLVPVPDEGQPVAATPPEELAD